MPPVTLDELESLAHRTCAHVRDSTAGSTYLLDLHRRACGHEAGIREAAEAAVMCSSQSSDVVVIIN